VPHNHSVFDDLTTPQWLWYFHQIEKDSENEFIKDRNMTEYLASFIEPKAVAKIIKSRDEELKITDDDFSKILESSFGRSLPGSPEVIESADDIINADDLVKRKRDYEERQAQNKDMSRNYKYWSEVNL